MVLKTDVLLHLHSQADSVDGIAGMLSASREDTERAVQALLQDGLVGGGTAGYSQQTNVTLYTLHPEGTALANRLLDLSATQVAFPHEQSPAERFLFTLADDRPPAQRDALLALLDALPETTAIYRRRHAVQLGQVAVSYAVRALQSDPRTTPAGDALAKLGPRSEEEAAYVAQQIRGSYIQRTESAEVRAVLEEVAATCDALHELRLLGPSRRNSDGQNVAQGRDVDPTAYMAVGELTASTMKAAHASGTLGVDLYREAETIIEKLDAPLPGEVRPV